MPSIIGHSVTGLALDPFLCSSEERDWISAILLSNGPDLDFLPGILADKPTKYHAQVSHSIGGAMVAGILVGSLAAFRGHYFTCHFLRGSLLYGSHLFLDFLGKEAPDGQPLLWPFSTKCYAMQKSWFLTIRSRRKSRGFVLGLLTRKNVRAIGREVYSILPLWLLARFYAKQRK